MSALALSQLKLPIGRKVGWALRARNASGVVALLSALGMLTPTLAHARSAPVLRAHGHTLRWTGVGGHRLYDVLARVRGRRAVSLVVGRAVMLRPVPGASVEYRVMAAHHGSHWSNRIRISFPAATAPRGLVPAVQPAGWETPLITQIPIPAPIPTASSEHVITVNEWAPRPVAPPPGTAKPLAPSPNTTTTPAPRPNTTTTVARPPVLKLSGETLLWSAAGKRNVYRVFVRAPGKSTIVAVVGRTLTPAAVPGATVTYVVKAAYNETGWSNRVAITYPTKAKEPPPKEPPPKEEPPKEEEPRSEPPPGEGVIGRAKYQLDGASYFDSIALPQYAPWISEHVSSIYAYPPFGDRYVKLSGLPVIGYHDPATEGQAPLGASGIKEYLANVARDLGVGYAGVYVDDANWSFSPSPGPHAALANLLQALRAAAPTSLIEINSQYHDMWPLMKAKNPDVERGLAVTNVVDKEFGVGATAGITTPQDYNELFEYIDALHAKGIAISMAGDYQDNNVPTMEYNLATYFLANNGRDYVSGVNQTPGNWWAGYNVNLGKALSSRGRSPSGLWTRAFSGGRAYTVEPGAATQTIPLGKAMHSAQWGTTEVLTLKAGQGAVLTG